MVTLSAKKGPRSWPLRTRLFLLSLHSIHLEELADLFVQVLKLASECGLVKLGTVAVDSTKFKANASRHKAYERICKAEVEFTEQIKPLLERAKATDTAREHEPEARLDTRQREADQAKRRSENDDQQSRNTDGSIKRGLKYQHEPSVVRQTIYSNVYFMNSHTF